MEKIYATTGLLVGGRFNVRGGVGVQRRMLAGSSAETGDRTGAGQVKEGERN